MTASRSPPSPPIRLSRRRPRAAAIVVELEPLPAVITMAEALAPQAPLVHPDWRSYEVLLEGASRAGNVAWEATVVRGDTDAAFARDDVEIVESSFRIGRQNHVSFEPRAVVASYEDGRFHIETSTQVPWTVRNVTARILGIPASQDPGDGAAGRRRVRPQIRLLARALRGDPVAQGRPPCPPRQFAGRKRCSPASAARMPKSASARRSQRMARSSAARPSC